MNPLLILHLLITTTIILNNNNINEKTKAYHLIKYLSEIVSL